MTCSSASGHEIDVRTVLAAALLVSCGARTNLGGTHPLPDAQPPPGAFVQVACGEHHTCARRQDGAVFCWGLDTSEQTGAPESATSLPVQVALAPATSIGLGAYHSCAIVGARVACWGDDLVGQLASDVPTSAAPLDVGIAQATAVSGGFSHTCALLESGAIRVLGSGRRGSARRRRDLREPDARRRAPHPRDGDRALGGRVAAHLRDCLGRRGPLLGLERRGRDRRGRRREHRDLAEARDRVGRDCGRGRRLLVVRRPERRLAPLLGAK